MSPKMRRCASWVVGAAACLAACAPAPKPPPDTATHCEWPGPDPKDPYALGAMRPVAIEPPLPDRPVVDRSNRSRAFVDIGVGAGRVCGLRDDGTAQCFDAGSPDPVELPWQGIRKLVLGESPTCALLDDGTAHCDVPMPELGEVVSLSMGRDDHCAVARSGLVRCWEPNRPETVRQMMIVGRTVQVDAAFSHTCAVTDWGQVWCWGDNGSGQLGLPTPAKSTSPMPVNDVGNVVEVATGGDHTCARDGGGHVRCWGAGHYGQAGDGSADALEVKKTAIPGLVATRLVAGAHHSCALTKEGRAVCWGWNLWGQMGEPKSDLRAPAAVVAFPSVRRIGAHGAVTCALDPAGVVGCLGGYERDHFGPWRL